MIRYDSATVEAGNIVNEVGYGYNGWGSAEELSQAPLGAVTGPYAGFMLFLRDPGLNSNRLVRVQYSNGNTLESDYGSCQDNALSRPSGLVWKGQRICDYQYLGESTFVRADYRESQVRMDQAFGSGADPYDGLDRFGRIIDLRWTNYGSSTDVDRLKYGYDRAGNRLYRGKGGEKGTFYFFPRGLRLGGRPRGRSDGWRPRRLAVRFVQTGVP